jgi:hypothetical protein
LQPDEPAGAQEDLHAGTAIPALLRVELSTERGTNHRVKTDRKKINQWRALCTGIRTDPSPTARLLRNLSPCALEREAALGLHPTGKQADGRYSALLRGERENYEHTGRSQQIEKQAENMALTGGGKDSVHTVSMKYKTSLQPDIGKSWHKKNLTAAEKNGSSSCYSSGKKIAYGFLSHGSKY